MCEEASFAEGGPKIFEVGGSPVVVVVVLVVAADVDIDKESLPELETRQPDDNRNSRGEI